MDEQPVPYRPMPWGYLAVWIGLNLVLLGLGHVQAHGLSVAISLEQLVQIVVGSILGGWLWGWIFWKFWLYKKLPESRS